jgi:hypothetical protein
VAAAQNHLGNDFSSLDASVGGATADQQQQFHFDDDHELAELGEAVDVGCDFGGDFGGF